MARGNTSGSLAGMSVAELQKELSRRQRKLPTLTRNRSRLARKVALLERKIATIDSRIAALGGSLGGRRGRPAGGGASRGRNTITLVDALHQALKGRTMGIMEVAQAVKANGYKTNSPNFRVMVNQALVASKNKKLFRRIGRGRYTGI